MKLTKILISHECRELIRSKAFHPLVENEQLPNGMYYVQLDEEVIAYLQAQRHPNETWSDTIIRLISSSH